MQYLIKDKFIGTVFFLVSYRHSMNKPCIIISTLDGILIDDATNGLGVFFCADIGRLKSYLMKEWLYEQFNKINKIYKIYSRC